MDDLICLFILESTSMERKAEHDIARKLKVFNHANAHGNISKTCRYFGICRETFYVWHLQRYHDITVSRHGCYQVLKGNKLNRLPENIKKRSRNKFMRFDKKVPGHHVQVDVKFFLKRRRWSTYLHQTCDTKTQWKSGAIASNR